MARLADYFIVVGYDHEKPGKGVGRRRPRASPPPPAAVQWARRGRASRPGGGEAGGPGPAVEERWVDWGRAFAARASLAGGGRVSGGPREGGRGPRPWRCGRGPGAGGAGSVESLPARHHVLLWLLRAPGTAPSCRRRWEGGSTLCGVPRSPLVPCILSKSDAGGRPPGEEVLRVQRYLRSARPPSGGPCTSRPNAGCLERPEDPCVHCETFLGNSFRT